jgi:hypothetical protein
MYAHIHVLPQAFRHLVLPPKETDRLANLTCKNVAKCNILGFKPKPFLDSIPFIKEASKQQRTMEKWECQDAEGAAVK